jgi:hypothetical protein
MRDMRLPAKRPKAIGHFAASQHAGLAASAGGRNIDGIKQLPIISARKAVSRDLGDWPKHSMPEQSPLPPPTMASGDTDRRDLRLDLCRGLALWFILLDHIPDNALDWLTLRNYGFSDTTEVFFFVSGYTCMIAYGRALHERGWLTTIARALQRGWEIYVAFLLLLLAYLALVQAIGGAKEYLDETNTAVFFANPQTAVVRALLMQYMPVNTDVLPTFALLHAGFPALLWLLNRGPSLTLAGSLALYLAAHLLDWNLPAWPKGEWFFNPLAWQFLFVFGAWYAIAGANRLQAVLKSNTAMALAVLYLAFGFVVAMSWQFHALEAMFPQQLVKLIYPIDKSSLSPLRLLHFIALAVVVARLLPHDWSGLMTPAMKALIRCGENSLPIYCLSVPLALLAHVALKEVSGGLAMQVAVSLVGIALMIGAATLMTRTAKLDRHGPKLF